MTTNDNPRRFVPSDSKLVTIRYGCRRRRRTGPSARALASGSLPGAFRLRQLRNYGPRTQRDDYGSRLHPTTPPIPANHGFDNIVCLRFEEGGRYVEYGEQALECLEDRFADQNEPSWQRAHTTCAAFIAGHATADAAKSAFIVAAMAAGIAFEIAESLAVVERHVEEAANDGLLTILFHEDEAP